MSENYIYDVGVIGTFYDPLHIGHLNSIYDGANECKELYVVLFYSETNDSINYKVRYQWIYNLTNHFDNIKIILCNSNNENIEGYIKKEINKKIDVCYCQKEHNPIISNTKIINMENSIPYTSEEIKKNPLKHWEYLPIPVKAQYVKKILIIGNESTGKSVMSKSLANLYNTECVEEYSRYICSACGGENYMVSEDFEEIVYQHKLNIINATKTANKLLFIDTDAFMSYYYRNQCDLDFENKESILDDEEIIRKISGEYDLVLFMESDVPYVQDDLRIVERNDEEQRESCTKKIKELYCRNGIKYEIISGNYYQRLKKAQKIINKKFDL